MHMEREKRKNKKERKGRRTEEKKMLLLLTIFLYFLNLLIYNCINYKTILKGFHKKKWLT